MLDSNQRMISIKQAAAYMGLGLNRTRKFCKECGALCKYGRRTLVDKKIVDMALDSLGQQNDSLII